jgi:hypothetical protein
MIGATAVAAGYMAKAERALDEARFLLIGNKAEGGLQPLLLCDARCCARRFVHNRQ